MAGASPDWILLRYPGRCHGCFRQLPEGTRALHDGVTRALTCQSCASEIPAGTAIARGVAGASARREHRRRRARREQRPRDAFSPIGLGAIAAGLARLTEPQHQRAWARGAQGEEYVSRRLKGLLAGTGIVLLHDRRLPHSRANIDHLAVGPGGVTVIDTKNYKGKVTTERRGGLLRPRSEHLLIAGRDQTRLIEGVRRQVGVVLASLERAGETVDVRGALCMARSDGLPLLGHLTVSGVPIDGPKRVANLARRPGPLPAGHVQRVAHLLATALPAA
jgi:Nuclease-related domain